MDRIQLWQIARRDGRLEAKGLDEVANAEAERQLEDLLVQSPGLLMPGLTLVGRQLPTAGGPLDLIGVDQDGRLVIFELKRGTLTRDAVAQVLDYASDLAGRDQEVLARLIEEHSGQLGVARFDDFTDWFRSQYPDAPELLEHVPRMVLVGLGADERATRIVNYLASSGIDIQLVTFQAFRSEAGMFLARRLETVEVDGPGGGDAGTKQGNLRFLRQLAEQQDVWPLFSEVGDFIDRVMPAYRWPGKTGYAFSLHELTKEGRPTYRQYASLRVDEKIRGRALFSLSERAIEAAPDAVDAFLVAVSDAQRTDSSWTPLALELTTSNWPAVKEAIEALLSAVVGGWKQKMARESATEQAEAVSE